MRKELGKIQQASFGWGGYQEAMVGASFTLGGPGWGVVDFWGTWGIERSDYAKWTEQERIDQLGAVVMRLSDLLTKAKKQTVSALVGVPIEAEFENNTLKSWRVLEEVL